MGLAEDRIERSRRKIASILKYNGFSSEDEKSGDEVFRKNGEKVIFGKDVTYTSGSLSEVMPYDLADDVFSLYYNPPPSLFQSSLGLIRKSKDYIASSLYRLKVA